MKITLSKAKWETIGKKAGWMGKPKAPEEGEFGHGLSSEAMELLKQYDIRSNNMWKYNDFPDIQEGI